MPTLRRFTGFFLSPSPLLGSQLIVLAASGFASKSIWIKLAYADEAVEPILLMSLRMLFALPFFLAVALWRPGPVAGSLERSDFGAILWLGLLGYYLASWLDFSGLQYIPAGLERMILFLYPTFVLLFNALLHRRWVPPRQLLALVVSYGGILAMFGGSATTGASEFQLKGALLVLASALAFALYLTGAGQVMARVGSRRFTAWSMSVACVATLLHFLLAHPASELLVSSRLLLLGLVLALVSTVAPAFLMNAGIQRIGAVRASLVGSVGPVMTLAMAWLVLGETLEPRQMLGAGLVMAGVMSISLARTRS